MASQSAIAKLPRPDLIDPPNGPSAFQNLTDALDLITIPKFASAAARDATIPIPSGGQHAWLTDSQTLTEYTTTFGWVTSTAKTGTAWAQAEDTTTIGTITNTSAAPGSPVVGTTFVAPASGVVEVTVGTAAQSDSNGTSIVVSYEVRTGGTIGTGTVVLGAAFNRAVRSSAAVITGAAAFSGGTHARVLSGLTPGATYNVRTMHWVSGAGSGTITARQITVKAIY